MPPLPAKLAIVGGGPSAFYVASRLLSRMPHADPSSPSLRVHIFDRLWAPHGLVRYGVAPDHPEVKNCTNKFDQTAADPRFRFFGNVHVGTSFASIPHTFPLPLSSLLHSYTHVLFATGCTLPTLHPAIPPSSHCIPALSLVHWYTRHPSNPPAPALDKITHLTLIGNGNVSLDIARMLLTPPSVLKKYDVPEHVLHVLSRSSLQHVSIIARRGPLEAAFTNKELREMMHLPDASMVPLDPSLLTFAEGTSVSRQQRRTLELLHKGSQNRFGSTQKTWSLDFYRSPTALTSCRSSADTAELTLAHTVLDPSTGRAISTDQTSTLATSLVVTSLGFHVDPTAVFFDPSSAHLRAQGGRILSESGVPLRNMYASGWSANGAKGVLATTMMDAYAVADTILSDIVPAGNVTAETTPASEHGSEAVPNTLMPSLAPHPDDPPEEIKQGIMDGLVTRYHDWNVINAEEVRRGALLGKERERMGWEDARNLLSLSQ
ncbi:FAD/NAD-P-binding domain-containing protein [Imleria badia]|nr:FAD/NAD-P-binding domain-containing protein [Imleria badia]